MNSGKIIKISIFFAIACAILVIVFSTRNIIQAEETPSPYKYYTSITIGPGDSLWSIACRFSDSHYNSIQEYIDEVKAINNLTSDTIHAYEYLLVPYYISEISPV